MGIFFLIAKSKLKESGYLSLVAKMIVFLKRININCKSFGDQKYKGNVIKCGYMALTVVHQIMFSQTVAAYLSNLICPYNDFLG